VKTLLGDGSEKAGTKHIFKPTISNENLHEIINFYEKTVVSFAKSKMQLSRVQYFYVIMFVNTFGLLPMKRHNQIDHFLIDKRRHSNIIDIRLLEELIVILTIIW
jgi:hypothetical protein